MAKKKVSLEPETLTLEKVIKDGIESGLTSFPIIRMSLIGDRVVLAWIGAWNPISQTEVEVDTDIPEACLKIEYREGYPCPPYITFVNPANYEDEDPKWWPEMTIKVDPEKKMWDIADIAMEQRYNKSNTTELLLDILFPGYEEGLLRAKHSLYSPFRVAMGVAAHRVMED